MICTKCSHPRSWHHGKQSQNRSDGTKYIRTCYGIGCKCEERFNS